MKRLRIVSLVAGLSLAACGAPAVALPPPPTGPMTLWNFLGIPQGLNKVRDAASNRRGNFPGAERKPPLKALADPANLQSEVPAIKKAAEIKTEEDMAPQKIKAVKYLATVGCGCYPGVKEALLESLGDCTEEVRYQTVLAIEDASTMHCETCNSDCCCNEELTKKLAELAYEKNDKGCWLEPSERVREAAKNAMRSCCPGQGPPPSAAPAETVPSEETIPTPPAPESVPESERSAQAAAAHDFHGGFRQATAGSARVRRGRNRRDRDRRLWKSRRFVHRFLDAPHDEPNRHRHGGPRPPRQRPPRPDEASRRSRRLRAPALAVAPASAARPRRQRPSRPRNRGLTPAPPKAGCCRSRITSLHRRRPSPATTPHMARWPWRRRSARPHRRQSPSPRVRDTRSRRGCPHQQGRGHRRSASR